MGVQLWVWVEVGVDVHVLDSRHQVLDLPSCSRLGLLDMFTIGLLLQQEGFVFLGHCYDLLIEALFGKYPLKEGSDDFAKHVFELHVFGLRTRGFASTLLLRANERLGAVIVRADVHG